MIDHLICDCDGVLVDSEVVADRVMLEVLTETFPGIDFRSSVKTPFGQQTSRFLASLESQFGIVMPPDFVNTIEARVLLELARCGLPVAVVSNSGMARVRASARRAGFDDIDAGRVFSAQQGACPKPYPRCVPLRRRNARR